MKEFTLAIIKPDAVKKNYTGDIIAMIIKAGFSIIGMKMLKLSKQQAAVFYEIHSDKFFYSELIEYMSSGPIIALVLNKEKAVADFRELIGNTDPSLAIDGSIRKLFAESKSVNAIHGSDSVENGLMEVGFFFSKSELLIL